MRRRSVIFVIVILVFLTSQSVHGITWVNETRSVSAYDSNGWVITITAESSVYIFFQVFNGSDISLRVFDYDNYLNWSNGYSSETVIERINSEQDSIAFSVENVRNFYIILDNRDNSISVDVEVIVQDSPIESGSFEGTPTIITLIIFGIIFTIGIVVLAIILLRKRGQSKEESSTGSTTKTKKLQIEKTSKAKGWFCPNCKKKVIDVEEYCSYCGHRIYKNP
ncbi:MAG: zinc ribbon domain-containing protein [Candidatus Heimdallarchaeota archaeon]|nr:zinc ribbon domain-containing protein [Candidatus Heimdallarchaeota archaeon]